MLAGHEAWIHSIRWNPAKAELLSASMDKCIIVWTEADGIWTENVSNHVGFLVRRGLEAIVAVVSIDPALVLERPLS